MKSTPRLPLLLRLVHWVIIANFLVEMLYAGYMIFVVFGVPDGGPLFSQALDFPHETMVTRRLYAIEFWIAAAGLSLYLGITEMAPRLLAIHAARSRD